MSPWGLRPTLQAAVKGGKKQKQKRTAERQNGERMGKELEDDGSAPTLALATSRDRGERPPGKLLSVVAVPPSRHSVRERFSPQAVILPIVSILSDAVAVTWPFRTFPRHRRSDRPGTPIVGRRDHGHALLPIASVCAGRASDRDADETLTRIFTDFADSAECPWDG